MQIAFVTTTSESYKQIKLWVDYHKSIGVGTYYLFVDGQVGSFLLLWALGPNLKRVQGMLRTGASF